MSEWRLCCRLCANRKPDNYTNVFYHEALNVSNSYMTLVQVIEKCFSVQISPEDDFSKVLCSQCLRLINDIVDFSERVIKVQEMFNHMIYDAEQSQLNVDANDDDTVTPKKCTIMTGEQSPTCSRISETSIHIKDELEEEEEENIEGIKELEGEEHVYESSANQEDGSCLDSDHSVKDEKFDYVDSQKECNECAKEFESFDYYHEHLELIHGKRKSRDSHFDAKVRKVNYEELCELRSNAGDISLNLSCNDCVQQFETFHAYKMHMESMHGKGRREKWKCPKCNKTVMTSFNLKRHLLTHIRKKPDTERDEKHFVSEVSEMCLRNQNSLKIYMQRHAPFECGICKKRFKNPARLKVHGEIHDSHKHICNICGQQLNTRCALKGHMLVHSGKKQHKCDYCDQGFYSSSTLKRHLLSHSGIKPYVCNFCDRTFTTGTCCRIHKRKIRPEELATLEANSSDKHIIREIPKRQLTIHIRGKVCRRYSPFFFPLLYQTQYL